jgi:cardiolipin synthase A/B
MFDNAHWWGYSHLLSIVTVLLTIVFVAILLRSRRSPGSAMAWLFVVVLLPYVGIPFFLIFGVRKMRRGRTQNARNIRQASPVAPRPNQELRFLTTGKEAYFALRNGIRGAREEISLATFIIARDETGQSLLEELTRKAAAGVRVRLLLDAWGSSILMRPSLREFHRAGGQSALFMPLLHLPFKGQDNLRNHRKIAIFDEKSAWFGGMNLTREYMGPRPEATRWTDLAVWLEGPSVLDLATIFDQDWRFAAGDRPTRPVTTKPEAPDVHDAQSTLAEPLSASKHIARVISSGPDCAGDTIYDALLEACYAARKRIWIVTPYFIPDESLDKALVLARKRGVDVAVCVPRKSNHRIADLSRGSYLRGLHQEGARILFYPRMNHAKMVLIDETLCLVGSANFDLRSLLYNYEVGVFLHSPEEIREASDWMKELFQVSSLDLPKAGVWRELAEGVGRLFGPLL